MTPQPELEIQGNFLTNPFAELLAELAQVGLDGSLRVENKQKKCVIYFKGGRVVFAASNSRSVRLYDVLLSRGKITKEDLANITNFANDFELTAHLEDRKIISKDESNQLFAEQIESILFDILNWTDGNWSFSSLKRAREGLEFSVDTNRILLDYVRCLPPDTVLGRFRSLDEQIAPVPTRPTNLPLMMEESFALSLIVGDVTTVADIIDGSAMTDAQALIAIYTLWLGGYVTRVSQRAAFSAERVSAIRDVKLELKQSAKVATVEPIPEPVTTPEETTPESDAVLSVEQYLKQVEEAATHYDILGVDAKADVAEIKRSYFALAKMFHPDKYHAEGGETLKRIQHAFTELAQAHETLKSAESREVYDYRVRKELADRERHAAAPEGAAASVQVEQAEQHFERGYALLMDDELDAAMPFLARAVHFAPKVARFHAYYGKALSLSEEKWRHKAESEMQLAIKLEPNNATFRILLAEFFMDFNLMKRAEGELNRLLAIFPDNREARAMLASLRPNA